MRNLHSLRLSATRKVDEGDASGCQLANIARRTIYFAEMIDVDKGVGRSAERADDSDGS